MPANAKTTAERRLALQIAIQLPEDVDSARRVLALSAELLSDFLVEPSTLERARRLGWNIEGQVSSALSAMPVWFAAAAAALCGLCSLLITVPLAMLLFAHFGAGAVFCFLGGVVIVALVFGTVPALVVGSASAILYNLLVVPPNYEFTVPTSIEILFLSGYVTAALLVPWVADRRSHLRRTVVEPLLQEACNVVKLRPAREA